MNQIRTEKTDADVATKTRRRAVAIAMAITLTVAACGDSGASLAEVISADAPTAAVPAAAVEGRLHTSADAAERWAASAAAANRFAGMSADAAERWGLHSVDGSGEIALGQGGARHRLGAERIATGDRTSRESAQPLTRHSEVSCRGEGHC